MLKFFMKEKIKKKKKTISRRIFNAKPKKITNKTDFSNKTCVFSCLSISSTSSHLHQALVTIKIHSKLNFNTNLQFFLSQLFSFSLLFSLFLSLPLKEFLKIKLQCFMF